MQRQGRKLPTNNGALSAGTADYGRPSPITWFSKAEGSPTRRGRRPNWRTLSGALKAKMPSASNQTLRSNMKSFSASPPNGALEMTTPTSTTRSSTESQARVVRRGCHTFQKAACLKDEEISTLPRVKSTQPKSASSKWTMPTAVVGGAPGGRISVGKAKSTAYVTQTRTSKTTPILESACDGSKRKREAASAIDPMADARNADP